jgi:hypothetical protein
MSVRNGSKSRSLVTSSKSTIITPAATHAKNVAKIVDSMGIFGRYFNRQATIPMMNRAAT